jgi:hypothetical protein
VYRIHLYDFTGTTCETVFFDASVRAFSKRINAPGRLNFSLPYNSPKVTDDNLQKYKRVRLYRKGSDGQYTPVWYGYIEAHKRNGAEIDVFCVGALKFFEKRFTVEDEAFDGEGSVEAFGLLSDCNSDGETGITAGTGNVVSERDLVVNRQDVLRAWEDIARAHNAEFEIDENGEFNFVSSMGTDQSSVVTLTFNRDGTPGGNVEQVEDGEDGAEMANRVIATTTAGGGLTTTRNDPSAQADYGNGTDDLILAEVKQFNQAQDQPTLDAMADSYLSQVSRPITDFRIVPTMAVKKFNTVTGERETVGLMYEDITLGDLVTVRIQSESQSLDATRRVVEILVTTDENLHETVQYTLSEAGVFVTAALLDFDQVGQLRRKLREIESVL